MRVLACLLLAACSSAPRNPTAEPLGFEGGEAALTAAHSPTDIAEMCERTKHHAGALRDKALAATTDADLLTAFHDYDRVVTIASGTVSVVAEIHPDAAVRTAAQTCAGSFNALITDVVTGPLIVRLGKLSDPYAQRVVTTARVLGAGLSAEAAAELVKLQDRESVLTGEMSEALGSPPKPVVVTAARLAGVPSDFMASHPADAQGNVTLQPIEDADVINRYATDKSVALELLRARRAVALPNVERLREVLTVRRRMAELLGCPSYVECQAHTRMVQSSERTATFLAQMTAMIGELDGPYRKAVGLTDRVGEMELKLVEAQARVRLGQEPPDAWYSYFETEPALDRLLGVVGRGIGLEFVATKVPVWSPDVRVFDVKRGGKVIGRFYFDLYLRPGKAPGVGSSTPFVPRMVGSDAPVSVAISIGITPGQPSLIRPTPLLRVLMHELGHSIDFLFETQSSFAASEQDFFDIPSQLFEVWAETPEFLTAVGRKNGKPLPPEGARALRADMQWDTWRRVRSLTAMTAMDFGFHGAQVPADLTAVHADAWERVFPLVVDRQSHPEAELFLPTIMYAGNGHALAWGLAICTDIAGEFSHGFTDPATWKRLIDQVFSADGPATPRIEKFLGRPWNLDRLRARALPPLGH